MNKTCLNNFYSASVKFLSTSGVEKADSKVIFVVIRKRWLELLSSLNHTWINLLLNHVLVKG